MSRIQTLQQILAERESKIGPRPEPKISPSMEPPPTANEPEDDEDFDPRSIFGSRETPVAPIEFIPPRDHLLPGTERQLAAFAALRASLGFTPEAPRPAALDSALVAALEERWGDEDNPYEILRDVREHDPAGYSTIDFLSHMSLAGASIMLRDGEDGNLWPLVLPAKNLGPMRHSNDVRFKINPVGLCARMGSLDTIAFRNVLLRFNRLPEETALRILPQLPVWVRAIYRRPGFPVEALLKIDANTAGEFHSYVVHLRPHLVAVGADPDCLTPTAFSRLPVAQRNETIEDILYMDTRPIPVDARPIVDD